VRIQLILINLDQLCKYILSIEIRKKIQFEQEKKKRERKWNCWKLEKLFWFWGGTEMNPSYFFYKEENLKEGVLLPLWKE